MNPYEIDVEKLKKSKKIKSQKELLKLQLVTAFLRTITDMKTDEVLSKTGLHKSDLSRLKSLSVSRFSIDRMIGLLENLGLCTEINIGPKKAS